jgi:hypothetical protein
LRWPGETHIVRAAFDEPPDREPEGNAFYDERVPWVSWPAQAQ